MKILQNTNIILREQEERRGNGKRGGKGEYGYYVKYMKSLIKNYLKILSFTIFLIIKHSNQETK